MCVRVWVWWLHFSFSIKYMEVWWNLCPFFHRILQYFVTHVRWICFPCICKCMSPCYWHAHYIIHERKKIFIRFYSPRVQCECVCVYWVGSLPRRKLSIEYPFSRYHCIASTQHYVYVFLSPSYWHSSHFPMLYTLNNDFLGRYSQKLIWNT